MFNLEVAKNYLLHQFTAKNRHGLHSPFVYQLVDTVIYDFHAKKVYDDVEKIRKQFKTGNSSKVDQLIYRLVADIKPGNIILLGNISIITSTYLQKASLSAKTYTALAKCTEKPDLVFINTDKKEQALKYFESCLSVIHNDTMLIIENTYKNKDMKQAWAAIQLYPQVTVTVDLFWIGLIFFRKGQVKEDFKIRF